MKYRGASSEPSPIFNIQNQVSHNKLPWSSKCKWDHLFKCLKLRQNADYQHNRRFAFLLPYARRWRTMRNEGSPLVPMACKSLPNGCLWLKLILISLFFNDLHRESRKRLYYLRVENSVWSERNLRTCGGKNVFGGFFSENTPNSTPEIAIFCRFLRETDKIKIAEMSEFQRFS